MLDLEQLKARRERLQLTCRQAAKRGGLKDAQHWHNIERGRFVNITMSTLGKLAKGLGCSPKDLLK